MPRIIVDIQSDMPADEALRLVAEVVQEGHVSESATGPHYCWVTKFGINEPIFGVVKGNERIVITRQRKRGQKSDSFIVR
jgi:hypothetical protein